MLFVALSAPHKPIEDQYVKNLHLKNIFLKYLVKCEF